LPGSSEWLIKGSSSHLGGGAADTKAQRCKIDVPATEGHQLAEPELSERRQQNRETVTRLAVGRSVAVSWPAPFSGRDSAVAGE
jgi:hypothetical protein